jgi:hypothetical protein
MPRPDRKRVFRVQFRSSDTEKKDSPEHGMTVPSMSKSAPPKPRIDAFSGKFPLKIRDADGTNALPTHDISFLDKRVRSSCAVKETLMQKEHANPQFFSLSMGKGKLTKHSSPNQLINRKARLDGEDSHLPYAKRLLMFQALLGGPLHFLDLQGRFGVSKITIKRLVEKKLLAEMWGPKDVGVRFRLTRKGKTYLRKLEAAAVYEPKIVKKDIIDLKYRI